MKKILSVVLCVALVFSFSIVAAAEFNLGLITKGFSTGGIVGAGTLDGVNGYTLFFVNGYDNLLYSSTGDCSAEYGSEVFVPMYSTIDCDFDGFKLDMIRSMKVKAEWEEGGDLIEAVSVTVIKVLDPDETYYVPVIKIKLKDSESTSTADVMGKITLNKSKGEAAYRIKDAEVPVQFSVGYRNSYREMPTYVIDQDKQFISAGDPYLLKFDYDDEVELSFGTEPNEGSFTVDVSGQGKLLLLYDTTPNTAVEAANPTANMVFFGFNNAQFNRTGEFFYETETGKYIYALVDGMPVAIAGAVYDEADGGFRFNTRTLGCYVISDIPLVAPNAEAAKAAVPSGTERYIYLNRGLIA